MLPRKWTTVGSSNAPRDFPRLIALWQRGLLDLEGMKRILTHTATPVLQGGHIYSARSSGELVCLDAATGEQLWEVKTLTKLRNGSSIHLIPCGETTYLFTDQGDFTLGGAACSQHLLALRAVYSTGVAVNAAASA